VTSQMLITIEQWLYQVLSTFFPGNLLAWFWQK